MVTSLQLDTKVPEANLRENDHGAGNTDVFRGLLRHVSTTRESESFTHDIVQDLLAVRIKLKKSKVVQKNIGYEVPNSLVLLGISNSPM